MLLSLSLAFIVSTVLGALVIRYHHLHGHLTTDLRIGPQKFHATDAARIGGIPIFLGWIVGVISLYFNTGETRFLWMILPPLPALFFGLLEDFTKTVSPRSRLLATFVSASIGFYLLNAQMNRIDIPLADALLQNSLPISLLVTMLCVGGVAHSFNIIDGYNGLSGMVSVLVLLALSYVAFKTQQGVILGVSFSLLGAILGFLVWNFPKGLLFAGDGGAYLMGFLVAETGLLLVNNSKEVSPWFPLLLVIYPVFETLFSMYRRRFLQRKSIGHPDALHLHQIIYRRLVRWMVGSKQAHHATQRNSMTSPYLWGLTVTSVFPGVIFWRNSLVLGLCIVLFIFSYLWFYRSLIRFRSPKFLKIEKEFTPVTSGHSQD